MRACGVLRPCTILALASSPRPSAILNVFGLIMIVTTYAPLFQPCSEQSCFNHDSRNAQSDLNTFHSKTCFIRDQTNHVPA